MHHILTKKLFSHLLFSALIATAAPAYGVWNTLQLLLEKSKKVDSVKLGVGAMAVSYLAYNAYQFQLEMAEKERQLRYYEALMNGTCPYLIEKRQDDIMVRQVSKAGSLKEQYEDCVRLARFFGDKSMTLKAKIEKSLAQKKHHKSSIDSPVQSFQRDIPD